MYLLLILAGVECSSLQWQFCPEGYVCWWFEKTDRQQNETAEETTTGVRKSGISFMIFVVVWFDHWFLHRSSTSTRTFVRHAHLLPTTIPHVERRRLIHSVVIEWFSQSSRMMTETPKNINKIRKFSSRKFKIRSNSVSVLMTMITIISIDHCCHSQQNE